MEKTLTSIIFILFCSLLSAQAYNQYYATINVYNNQRQNPNDFIFSYDVVNGQHTCVNNFEVVNKFNIDTNFKFKIFINNVDVYTGIVNTPPYGSVFFDNAFINCYSTNSIITIKILQ